MKDLKRRYMELSRERWDSIGRLGRGGGRIAHYYHTLLNKYYSSMVPEGARVLELGCGFGDTLAALKPSFGVGVDFSRVMVSKASEKHPDLFFIQADVHDIPIRSCFDVIIISDLINDLWDVQTFFTEIKPLCHNRTRIVLNFFNNIWRVPITIAQRIGLAAPVREQNWLSPEDVCNILELAGFQKITHTPRIVLPVYIPLFSTIMNRFIGNLPILNLFSLTNFMVARPIPSSVTTPSVSIIIPAKNEAGNIGAIFASMPKFNCPVELIFVEGGSTDGTFETIENAISDHPHISCKLLKQPGKGKSDAIHAGCRAASGDILIFLDADMTVPPEYLPHFIEALASGKGEFINGVRLVYPLEEESMRFANMVANKLFGLIFSWILGQHVKDTLCGTKALWKKDYDLMVADKKIVNFLDPFGDFDLLIGAARLNLKIVDLPVRYQKRRYGNTNIKRWRHGWILIKMAFLASFRIRFI